MHSHVLHFNSKSAVSCSPFQNLECSLIQSLSVFEVHSHVVLMIVRNALSSSPALYSITADSVELILFYEPMSKSHSSKLIHFDFSQISSLKPVQHPIWQLMMAQETGPDPTTAAINALSTLLKLFHTINFDLSIHTGIAIY